MGYSVKAIDVIEAKKKAGGFPYALIYKLSEIQLCKGESLKEEDWKECFEARLFGEDGEVHIFENVTKAVHIEENGAAEYVDQVYEISGRFLAQGKQLVVRQYLEPDEDGQMVVKLTRLVGIR